MIILILLWVALVSQCLLALGAIIDFAQKGFKPFEFIVFLGVLVTIPVLYFILSTGTFTR